MIKPLRPWRWATLPSYNGFTHEERVRGGQLIWWFLDNGWMARATRCSISGSTERIQYHCENYYAPWEPIPLSQTVHFALHKRFRQPDAWRRIVDAYAISGDEWFCRLAMEPVDLASELRAKLGDEVRAMFLRAPLPAGGTLPAEIKEAERVFLQPGARSLSDGAE
jgi:hypothetical protein